MKNRNIAKWMLIVSVIGMGIQAGTAAFALVDSSETKTAEVQTQTSAAPLSLTQEKANVTPDTTSVELSPEVTDAIRASDPSHYEKNITNYKELLVRLDVQPKFRKEIERLLIAGRKVPDVLIAYEFLYQEFGTGTQLDPIVIQKSSGQSWELIFKEYHQAHPAFLPQVFDMDELEELHKSKVSTDDIMIADRLSFVSGKPFKELLANKLEQKRSWKEVAVDLAVLNTASTLPRVQITPQQINRWTQPGKMTEAQVAAAFVLASKAGKKPENVIEQLLNRQTPESILAEGYLTKYE